MAKSYTLNPLAFYDDAVSLAPEGATPITDQDHARLMEAQGQGLVLTVVDGVLDAVHPVVDPIMALAKAQSAALIAMRLWIEAFTAPLTERYPSAERDMWPLKFPAARAVLNGTASEDDRALFAGEAALIGSTVEVVAAAVSAKGQMFARVSTAISGLRQKTEQAIGAAKTPDAVGAALLAAKAEAQALATSLGLSVKAG